MEPYRVAAADAHSQRLQPAQPGLRAGDLRLCAYDWELATLHLPQIDLAEFLLFTLDGPIDPADIDRYVELHRRTLSEATGKDIAPESFREGYRHALHDLLLSRIGLYLMGHTVRRYSFMPRVLRTLRTPLQIEERAAAGWPAPDRHPRSAAPRIAPVPSNPKASPRTRPGKTLERAATPPPATTPRYTEGDGPVI